MAGELRELAVLFDIEVDEGMVNRAQAVIDSFRDAVKEFSADVDQTMVDVKSSISRAISGESLRELATEDGLKDAEKDFEAFAENVHTYIAGAVVALVGSAVGITEVGRQMAVAIDSGSRQIGVSRREFQQWEAVARAAGAEGDKIIDVMANIQEKARDAALDPRGQMAKTFEELGIAAKDANGQIRSGPQLMRDAADALARMGPGTERTATAMALFGDAGRELLPVLGQGSAAINRVIADFERLGGGLSDEAIESSLEFNRAVLELKSTLAGALSPILKELNPVLTTVAQKLRDGTARLRELTEQTTLSRATVIAFITGAIIALGYAIKANLPAIAAWVITWAPFIAGAVIATGAAIALGLAIDDVTTFLEGGDSAIGAWLDALGGAGTATTLLFLIKDTVGKIVAGFFNAKDAAVAFADQATQKIETMERGFERVKAVVEAFLEPLREAGVLIGALPGMQNASASPATGPRISTDEQGVPRVSGEQYAQDVVRLSQSNARAYAPAAAVAGRATTITRQTDATLTVHANGIVDQGAFARQLASQIGPVLAQITRDAADDSVSGSGL